MPAFSVVSAQRTTKPATVVLLKPEHFAASWPDRPRSDVAVGVRLLSEAEVQTVKAEAAKNARAYHPEADEDDELLNDCFKDELIKLAVARAATNPNDAREPYFPAPDDMVGEAWTPATIRRLWDELERVTLERSPVQAGIEDEEIGDLVQLLEAGVVGRMAIAREVRARKLLRFLLDELRDVERGVEEALG